MNKCDKRMTITINAYGKDVKITAPAWLLNEISMMYSYSAELHEIQGRSNDTFETEQDRGLQIYYQLKDKGLYE